MTQRKLTTDELAKARRAYLDLGGLYNATGADDVLVKACIRLTAMIENGTSDGKPPIQADRVPTAADIGKRVKVRSCDAMRWTEGMWLIGFRRDGLFVVESPKGFVSDWERCIIDQEAVE